MGHYPSDRNQVSMFFESGTWGNVTGGTIWPGQVQSFDIDRNINLSKQRHLGTSHSRNVASMTPLARTVTVSLEMYPQNWRMLGYALGSVYTHNTGSPSPPVTHQMTEAPINELNGFTSGVYCPWNSFSLEEVKQFNPTGLNINRLANGIVIDSVELSANEGEFITMSVNGMAKDSTYTSGTGASLSEVGSPRPYMWKDATIYTPSGTKINGIKNWRYRIAQTATPKHYNSQTPDAIPVLERNYEVELTMDQMSQHYKVFNDAYQSGNKLNMHLGIVQNAGSNYLNVWMSGCKVDDIQEPVTGEGLNEMTVTITPQICNALAADSVDLYNPW